ncbi:hypothetical protein DJ71_24695 [Halorubrum sp. E3]|nr:hypothetical protein DJ71_24695 [Halorubrum sp. E3]
MLLGYLLRQQGIWWRCRWIERQFSGVLSDVRYFFNTAHFTEELFMITNRRATCDYLQIVLTESLFTKCAKSLNQP